MKFHVKKQFGKLIPCYNSDADKLNAAKLKEGEFYEVEITKKRNPKFLKKYFALINLCFDNQEQFEDVEDLRKYMTCKAGYYKTVDTGSGKMIMPLSISFAKMDETEFDDLYQKTITQVCLFLGCEEGDLLDEVLGYA